MLSCLALKTPLIPLPAWKRRLVYCGSYLCFIHARLLGRTDFNNITTVAMFNVKFSFRKQQELKVYVPVNTATAVSQVGTISDLTVPFLLFRFHVCSH